MSHHRQQLIFLFGLPCLVNVAIRVVVPRSVDATPIVDAVLHAATVVVIPTSHKIQLHPFVLSASFVERSYTLLVGATNALIQHLRLAAAPHPQAFYSSQSLPSEENWYLDTGATHHITNDL